MVERFHPKSQEEWRAWLELHHKDKTKVALIHFKKHTNKRVMSSQEAMDEAICFGWIDTTVNKLDEDSYIQHFVRRSKKGRFSKNTKKYAERLIEEGRMSNFGLKVFNQCLKNGLTDEHIPDNPEAPKELLKELNKNKKAKKFFEELAPSYKKLHLRWLFRAKLQETRKKRIKLLVSSFSERKRLF